MSKTIEYRVRPVTRFVVTRFISDTEPNQMSGCETRGEFDREETAYDVGYALCKLEHEQLGYPIADERIQYPKREAT